MAELNLSELLLRLESPEAAILADERSYSERICEIAGTVVDDKAIRLVLLAGPSGSGKTTTANLIADAVRALGEDALVVSLDDFYRAQDDKDYPRTPDGKLDYESPEALDLCKLSFTLSRVVAGESFEVPKYDFKIGAPTELRKYPPMPDGCVIIEGLHALNPKISASLPREQILKTFVSVSTNINEGEERIISGRKIRFVRRLVRDSIYRGSDAQRTLSLWREVLAAEDVYLYPYKSSADLAFNTFHSFELSVLRDYALSLITEEIAEREPYAKTVREALKKIPSINEQLVPDTSLIREFIPGGKYEALY